MPKILTLVLTTLVILESLASLQALDFNKDVRPLLASKCYACHGPDEEGRKAKLRLDIREEALENDCLLYTSPSPRDATLSRMPSSA